MVGNRNPEKYQKVLSVLEGAFDQNDLKDVVGIDETNKLHEISDGLKYLGFSQIAFEYQYWK